MISENDEKDVPQCYRNGDVKKNVQTQIGELDVKIPRHRNRKYKPLF
ncbi:MAG: hypothetical protein HFJ89_10280 [Oscillospiraceae bacterium]|nr:hypothetical protein [Oscillospiraceae bacterium]